MIHCKKNRPALQRRDILTVSLVFSVCGCVFCGFFFFFFLVLFVFFIGNLLKFYSTNFLVVLLFLAFYTASFSSKHFFLGLFLRSLSTQLFFLVVLLLLLLNMTAFSLLSVTFSHCFPEPSSIQLFS